MKLDQSKHSMRQAQQKRHDAQVPAVIEQRKKAAIQSTQGADAQYDVQQQECSSSKCANQQRLRCRAWIAPCAHTDENPPVQRQQRQKGEIIDLLLPVPTDRAILNAHGSFPTAAVSNTVW